MQRTLLALALIATAGAAYAQTPAGQPLDPNGRPYIGSNDWVRQPGDQPGPAGSGAAMAPQMNSRAQMNAQMATAPAMQPMAPAAQPVARGTNKLESSHAVGPEPIPMDAAGPRQAAMKDEYGFRYDNEGNRLDARGNVISPHIPQR